MSDILDRIMITPAARDRWLLACEAGVERWLAQGFRPCTIGEEAAQLLPGGTIRIWVHAQDRWGNRRTEEMLLAQHEWAWKAAIPSVN